jgi:aspartyl-tRNA(Asn)/glutamyl-tRNA(Gln) amidotransferase subunit A
LAASIGVGDQLMLKYKSAAAITSVNDLAFASLEHLASLLSSGEISSVELTQCFLDRIQEHNHELHAFCDVFGPVALLQAETRDAERLTNPDPGPLHGIPCAIKDIFDIAYRPTRAGSKALTDLWPDQSAHAVSKLETAGMIVLGRTHMTEFAFGGWGTNPVMGPPRNPWDAKRHRVAGGSSSGSAVAVSAGLAPVALGTDTGGSVRTPATWCGLIGLKTSHGLIGRGGVVPLSPTHDTIGTFTRTIHDTATMLLALVGPDQRDEASQFLFDSKSFGEIGRDISGLQIGRLQEAELKNVAPEIRAQHDLMLADLEAMGAQTKEIRLPLSNHVYLEIGGDIMSFESYRELGHHVELAPDLVDPAIQLRILAGRDITEERYRELLQTRLETHKAFEDSIRGVDAVVFPGCHQVAVPLAEVDEIAPSNFYGRTANFLDLAALSIPSGLTAAGMPTGIQIMVRKFEDAKALRIGAALEAARGGLVLVPPEFSA